MSEKGGAKLYVTVRLPQKRDENEEGSKRNHQFFNPMHMFVD